MSALPHNDTLQPGVSLGRVPTPVSKLLASSTVASTSKRVCFYKSGDPQFSGHRVVINSRTFKTFDALLDALSKKVSLPFGVRTITTPKGTHAIRSLDDLRDGASYVCSDQKRVKPLNLDEVNRRQVPWNTSRPTSTGRHGRRGLIRQLVKRSEVGRTAKKAESSVAVWTPKRLVVFKNNYPSIKHIVVLQKKTAPNFKALLDYLSQVMHFPILKLYTADGRRVDGLRSLILCSGVVVAAGNEPFRPVNYSHQGSSQPSQSALSESTGLEKPQPLAQHQRKQVGIRPRSRNFSLSSERYFVNQINKSLNESVSEVNGHSTESSERENSPPAEPEEMETWDCMAGTEDRNHFIMPSEDDIEKSFRVNQDGSMTVEMKVRLTIKQEEMIHWTTTLSRTCVNSQQRALCSQPVSGYNSPDNNDPTIEAKRNSYEFKEEITSTDKSVRMNEETEEHCKCATSQAWKKTKPAFRRVPTPGPRHVRRKEASVENIKRVSQTEVQESTVGAYSYMECTAEGELTEGYRVVSHSSSSSTRPVPKPRKTNSGETKHKRTHSHKSSGMAEVLQLQNNGAEITETVMHIYESQGTYENCFSDYQVTSDNRFEYRTKFREHMKPDSTDSGPCSSSNDCDIDPTRQSTSSDSHNVRKNELLSLSSGQSSPSQKITNNLSTNAEKHIRAESSSKRLEDLEASVGKGSRDIRNDIKKTKMTLKSVQSMKSISSETTISDTKGQKVSVPGSCKDQRESKSPASQSHTGSEKNVVSSAECDKRRRKTKKKEKLEGLQKSQSQNLNGGNRKESEKDQNLEDVTTQTTSMQINTHDSNLLTSSSQNLDLCNTERLTFKKKLLDVLPSLYSAPLKVPTKPRSMNGGRTKPHEDNRELSESISMPVLHSSPSSVHQYVENWLRKIQPESVPYVDELDPHETEYRPRVEFQIGSGSAESSEIKSDVEGDRIAEGCPLSKVASDAQAASHPPVHITCERESVETLKARGFCKSMPSVRIHPAEQDSCMRVHKSSEALYPVQPMQGKVVDSGIKPVLKQLCLSIQSIRRASSHPHLCLEKEKSSSLPDFSSQVTSAFGSPSKALLSFLSVMTLRDSISSTGSKDPNLDNCPEALQVMQSLEKLASIEDEEELKASLSSLKSATSSHLKRSWKDFQERQNMEDSPPLSPRHSEQEFALEVNSEEEEQDKEHDFGIKDLMDELNMPEDLRREISSLMHVGLKTSEEANLTTTDAGYVNQAADNMCEDEEGAVESNLEALLEEERGCLEERASRDDDIPKTKQNIESIASDSEELHTIRSSPTEPTPNQDTVMEESGIVKNAQTTEDEASHISHFRDTPETVEDVQAIQGTYTSDETGQAGQGKVVADMVVNVQTSDESSEEETIQANLEKEVTAMMEYVPTSEERYAEEETSQVDEFEVVADNQTAPEEKSGWQKEVTYVQSEPEADTHRSESETASLSRKESEVNNDNDAGSEKREMEPKISNEQDTNMEEEDSYQETMKYTEHPDKQSVGSNTEVIEAHHYSTSEAEGKYNNIEEYVLDENQGRDEQYNVCVHEDDLGLEEECSKSDGEQQHDIKDKKHNVESYHSSIASCESDPHCSNDSEVRSEDLAMESHCNEYDHNISLEEEEETVNENEDAKSEVSECIRIDGDTHINDIATEEQCCHDSEGALSKDSESEEDPHGKLHYSDQDHEAYDEDKSECLKCQESEDEHNVQTIKEVERIPGTEAISADEKDKEADEDEDEDEQSDALDSDKDLSSEPCNFTEPDQEIKPYDQVNLESCKCQESEVEYEVQASEEEHVTNKDASSAEDKEESDKYADKESNISDSDTDEDAKHHQSYTSDREMKTLKTESQDTEGLVEAAVDHGFSCMCPIEISQELLDFVNFALLSSALTFKYDTNGHLRIEPDRCKIRAMSLAKSNIDDQYVQKQLPSPNTSDLSDYRPETSDSCGDLSQVSTDIFTESGEEQADGLSIYQGNMKQSCENVKRCSKTLGNSLMKIHPGTDTELNTTSSLKSINSLSSFHDSLVNGPIQEPAFFSTSGSFNGDSESVHSVAHYTDSNEGVLIDKGRWLLKENHLIRKSPPVPMGMYENVDTTSADTLHENTSEDVPYAHCGSQQPPLTVISSSELEEMAKPPTPKCMYFNMPHSSDSDPFLDEHSIGSSKGGADIRKSRELKVSPMGDTSKMLAKKNGSLPSFTSVEFKMTDGKVHPEGSLASGAVVKSARPPTTSSRTAQEEESGEGLSLRCGRHCPIL